MSINTITDSATMLRRNLRHALRYPSMTIGSLAMPIFILLLFVGVFGGAMGSGISGASSGGYIDYAAPGIILMAIGSGCLSMAVSICVDMTEGIINRFRTMSVSRSALMNGHVVGSMIQTVLSTALVIAVALLMGFRPSASFVEWLAVVGLSVLVILALTWLAAGMGMSAKTPESASNTPLLIQFLPFISSAFVPTDSMPTGVRWFAEYQPFTPIIETMRGLLMGTEIGNSGFIAVGWCLAIAVVGYLWARSVFDKHAPVR